MDLLSLIVLLLLVGFALWLAEQLPIDATIKRVVRGLVLFVVVLWLLNLFVGPIHLPLRR